MNRQQDSEFSKFSTLGDQLVGRQILLVRLQAGVELYHYANVLSQPFVCLSGKFGSPAVGEER